jgi:hypothetical protein
MNDSTKAKNAIAFGAWNQGFYRSVRKAMAAAAEYLNHPDNPNRHGHGGTYRLWIIRHDVRNGWRLVNCGNRSPQLAEMERGFYGPLTAASINSHLKAHKLPAPDLSPPNGASVRHPQ